MPTPSSRTLSACSKISQSISRACSMSAVVSPPIPPPTIIAFIGNARRQQPRAQCGSPVVDAIRRLAAVIDSFELYWTNRPEKTWHSGRGSIMRAFVCRLAATAAFVFVVNAAAAQDKIRIGLIYTLAGPASALGQQSKNGFELALKDLGGKMGGKEVELFVADDELKPDVAIQKVRGLLERDNVDFVVGPIFSNILVAIHKPVLDAGK